MRWADELPAMQERRKAWQAKYGPVLKQQDELKRKQRETVSDLINRGLSAIEATDAERELVFDKTGFGL